MVLNCTDLVSSGFHFSLNLKRDTEVFLVYFLEMTKTFTYLALTVFHLPYFSLELTNQFQLFNQLVADKFNWLCFLHSLSTFTVVMSHLPEDNW